MAKWKKVIRYSLRVNGEFKCQYETLESAEKVAKKYQAKGATTSIKKIEAEVTSVNFGVI
jgi:hypothetical protein